MWLSGGVWNSQYGPSRGGHATCIVGYDDSRQMFKVQNQWGTSGGDNGFYWVTYNMVRNNCMKEIWVLYGQYALNTPDIVGDKSFCNSSNPYVISNLPTGSSVTWSTSPSGIVSISTNGNQATLTQTGNYNGTIRLTATINGSCIGSTYNVSSDVILGKGTNNFMINNIYSQLSPNPRVPSLTFNLEVTYVPAAIGYKVYLNNLPIGTQSASGGYTPSGFISLGGYQIPKCGVKYSLRVEALTPCGNLSVSTPFVIRCGGIIAQRFSTSQHPTTPNTLTVGVKQYTSDELARLFFDATALEVEKVQIVKIFNKEGEMVMVVDNIDAQLTNINIASLPQGIYTVEVYGNNDYRELQTFQYVTTTSADQLAEDIANANINILSPDAAKILQVLQQELYQQLRENADLYANSATLQSFFLNHEQGDFGKIEEINAALSSYDVAAAQALMANWLPKTQLELNCLSYYNFFVKYLNGTAFTNNDIIDLYSLSNLCPQTNGEIIYAARSLYNYVSQQEESFDDACNPAARRQAKIKSSKPSTTTDIIVYPNPSNGNFTIKFPAETKGINRIKVMDMMGKTMFEKNTIGGTQNINITQQLAKGIYMVQVLNSVTQKTQTQKLIIQ